MMTTRVTIKVDELSNCDVSVIAVDVLTRETMPGNFNARLKPGAEAKTYVHSGQDLLISEIPNDY